MRAWLLQDGCADALLWEGASRASLPRACDAWSDSTLDYFARAVDFTWAAATRYPDYDIALTGHCSMCVCVCGVTRYRDYDIALTS